MDARVVLLVLGLFIGSIINAATSADAVSLESYTNENPVLAQPVAGVVSGKNSNKFSAQAVGSSKPVAKIGGSLSLQAVSMPSLLYMDAALETQVELAPELIGVPLPYPNPFSLNKDLSNPREGYFGTRIGYELSADMDMKLLVYDMFGHKVLERLMMAGTVGGTKGWNEVPFNRDHISGFDLSSGVYFFLLVFEGKVLGKGKMAIVP